MTDIHRSKSTISFQRVLVMHAQAIGSNIMMFYQLGDIDGLACLVVDFFWTEDENSVETILIPTYILTSHLHKHSAHHEILNGAMFMSRSRSIHCIQRSNAFIFPW